MTTIIKVINVRWLRKRVSCKLASVGLKEEHVVFSRTSWSLKTRLEPFVMKWIRLERYGEYGLKSRIMINTSTTQNCMHDFPFTVGHFIESTFWPPKWPTVFLRDVKENRAISWHVSVDHYILLLNYLSNHLHFITNGSKCFSKTNSTDPRQRVPLTQCLLRWEQKTVKGLL